METVREIEKIKDNVPDVCAGGVYQFGNIYFVIIEDKEYPYEAVILTPYWELASEKDVITEFDGRKWGLISLIRYVDDEILAKSIKIGEIDSEDIKDIYEKVENGKEIPQHKRGLNGKYQDKFRKMEAERTFVINSVDLDGEYEIPEVVEIDLVKLGIDDLLTKSESMRLAAASFDELKRYEFGEMVKDDDGITIVFNDDFKGFYAEIFISGIKIYEDILPQMLKLKTAVRTIETVTSNMGIKYL